MKERDALEVLAKIDYEGFDYCFEAYSDFKEVKDAKFHKLRKAYLKAQESLEDYLLKSADVKDIWEGLDKLAELEDKEALENSFKGKKK